jgi:CheY-like chemotaxis protein
VIAPDPMRILYVEDDPLVREVTCEMLAQPAHEVVAVSSAEEALSVFKPEEFDLVVTDISLPGMSGMDMARHMLKLVPTAAIIIATGYDLHIGLERLGPHVRAIRKPFDLPQLEGLLNELWRETGRE